MASAARDFRSGRVRLPRCNKPGGYRKCCPVGRKWVGLCGCGAAVPMGGEG